MFFYKHTVKRRLYILYRTVLRTHSLWARGSGGAARTVRATGAAAALGPGLSTGPGDKHGLGLGEEGWGTKGYQR